MRFLIFITLFLTMFSLAFSAMVKENNINRSNNLQWVKEANNHQFYTSYGDEK